MKNREVAEVLYGIADILEMKGVQFRPNAYRKAARSVEGLTDDITELYNKGKLADIAGVGKNIAEKIEELISTGKLRHYEQLKKGLPKHIFELMEISGLGPRRIRTLYEKLGISSVKQLEQAVNAHKISMLAGFGEKSEEEIRKSMELFKRGKERMLLGYALPTALEIQERLKMLNEVQEVSIAGSLRRRKETIGDIDILVSSSKPQKVMDFFTNMPDVRRVLSHGYTKSSIITGNDLQVDLRVITKNFGAALVYFTGSKLHNIAIREVAIKKGLKISEYGVFRRKSNRLVAGKTEADVYKSIGLRWIEPELRENTGEIDSRLPKLIRYDDIKGDFHMHTHHSDGADGVNEMIIPAKQMGYDYVAITDHSKSERVANGNTEEEMLEEIKEIKALDKKTKGIKIFAGSEVDILPNGELDYPEDVLKKLDIVVGSVHSRFKSTRYEMTKRITTALQSKYLDILGHPTGRLIHRREPYEADLKKVFAAAVENSVLLEINAQPKRMDLKDTHVRMAKEMGSKFVINTDSHTMQGLKAMQFGIAIARRGWLEKKDVVNTYSLTQIRKFFRRLSF